MIGFKEKSKEGKIMKIVVINATEKKGVTFRLKKAFLSRFKNKDVIVEFYLPRDCPSLCAGCTTCFLKDQNLCKDAAFVQKIEKEMLGGFSFALGGRRNLDNREQLGLDNHTCRHPKHGCFFFLEKAKALQIASEPITLTKGRNQLRFKLAVIEHAARGV